LGRFIKMPAHIRSIEPLSPCGVLGPDAEVGYGTGYS
jgi:hypothetical protein